jgi:TetR/AcrR family transcriptional regulator, tetracycline repressor protein
VVKRRNVVERVPVTRALIASVAADLIRAEGLEALTMRSVAAKLGVSAMALYHHVEDKDEIIRLVGDDMLAGIELPDPDSGDWRDLLTTTAFAAHDALLSVPGMTSVLLTNKLLPNARRILTFCLLQFERAGLSRAEANVAYAGLHQLSVGRLLIETGANFEVHSRLSDDEELAMYMKALHSKASFEQAMSALLDQYDRSAKDRGASAKPRR